MPDSPHPDSEATNGRRTSAAPDPELERLWMSGFLDWPTPEEKRAVVDEPALHRADSLATLSGVPRLEAPPQAGPSPVPTPNAVFHAGSRFHEEIDSSATATVLPQPARGGAAVATGRLLDLARRGWRMAKTLVSDVVTFSRENPHVVVGAVIGAVAGASVGGFAGLVVGAGLGAAAGAGARVYLERSAEKRRTAQSSAQSHAQATRDPASVTPAPLRDTNPVRTRSAVTDRARSQQLGSPVRSATSQVGPATSAQVASSAALRANGTDRVAPSAADASRDSVTRPATTSAQGQGRRRSA